MAANSTLLCDQHIQPVSDFFEKGYLVRELPYIQYRQLKIVTQSLNWVQDEDGPYRLRWDRGAPPWDEDPFVRESLVAKWSMEHLPEKLKKTLDACLDTDSIGAEIISNLKLNLQWIDAWEGVEDIGWHWDGPAQSPVIGLVYLTEEEWQHAWGGQLQVGHRNPLPADWLTDYQNVTLIEEIEPRPGTWVWLNNLAPQIVHRPVPLSPHAGRRYTLTFGFDFPKT